MRAHKFGAEVLVGPPTGPRIQGSVIGEFGTAGYLIQLKAPATAPGLPDCNFYVIAVAGDHVHKAT